MEDFAPHLLYAVDESTLQEDDGHDNEVAEAAEVQQEPDTRQPDSSKKARGLRNGIFRAANLQDKLLEKLLSQVIPADDGHALGPDAANDTPAYTERPGFSVALMSNNFRRFNARIGVVFKFQARALRVLSWRRPTHTLSLLAVYTFVCLDPYLLFSLPLAIALFGILVPSFVARHPAPSSDSDRVRNLGYSPRGPPLAPARTVKPTKELSRDFFRNMGDLQNVMEDFSVVHDKIIALVLPKTNFSDEALSSAIFVLLFAACAVMMIAAHLLPLRFLALVGGWAGICSGHPTVARWIEQTKQHYLENNNPPDNNQPTSTTTTTTTTNTFPSQIQPQPQPQPTKEPPQDRKPPLNPTALFTTFLHSDILLDDPPETREVEIFELQRQSPTTSEWEPWLFSPSPYDPLSAPRLAGERPRGTRFFEDVLAPEAWTWSEKKWALDLWSREWVEERIITGVEVETEGERWVYDMWSEREAAAAAAGEGGLAEPVVNAGGSGQKQGQGRSGPPAGVSWEEGEEGMGRRGQWRRRRWVRMVKRRNVTSTGS